MSNILENSKAAVEAALEQWFTYRPVDPRLHEAMKYSLQAGGKRIRPALAFAAAEAVGGDMHDAMPVACAMEMIHTYSLVHDDLPAMDNDDLRRGRPTNHKVYGEALAILAGDALLTEAFCCLADPAWKIPADRRIDIVGIIAEGSGAKGMVAGQSLDVHYEGKEYDEKTLELIHKHKTGKLLRAAVLAGGRAAGASGEVFETLDVYGKAIGLAFQIADDILDVTGTAEQLGKNAGGDQKKEKATYPGLLGLDASRARAKHLLDEALEALKPFKNDGKNLAFLANLIVNRSS